METVKISWSGGKDSTAACILHLQEGHKCKIVCYVPMLTDEIPLISKAHYQHIIETAGKLKKQGAEVHIISGITYYDHTHRIISRGKRKGKYNGTGLGFGYCAFMRDSKIKAINHFDCGDFDYEDIGIAFDELNRQNQLNTVKRSILCEKRITEQEAMKICMDNSCLSPLYVAQFRDGCTICPNAKKVELLQYVKEYPEAVAVLMEIETICKSVTPNHTPYRGYKWFSDRIREAKQDEESKLIYADSFF